MPHEGYADPITNDESGFHSNVPVSGLTECVTQAIMASDVILAIPIVKTMDEVTHENSNRPLPSPMGLRGLGRPNTSLRPVPGSATLTHPIPHCAQHLDP